jgi:Transglycosylase-like domain
MKRLIAPAGAALAAAVPGIASAAAPGPGASAGRPTAAHASAYERAYQKVAKEFGHRSPGRNIVKDGVAGGRPATDAQVVASLGVLKRMLAPAPAPTTSSTAVSSSSGSSAGAAGVPACASESGTNYSTGSSNTNPSSGATGRYQILPSTAAAYGCDLSTPAGQDACAQTIYAHQGAGAWVGCGG